MSRTLLNIANDNNNRGKYPLFLGASLGFGDTVNVTYPEIEELYLDLRSMFWTENEFSMEYDIEDLKACPDSLKDCMVLNLLAQWLMDSLASRSIAEVLGPFVTNNELSNLIAKWADTEATHTRSYSYIIRSCFKDPNATIERGKNNLQVLYRSKAIASVFNTTVQMGAKWTSGELKTTDIPLLKKQLLRTVAALYALEAIAFMSSFAVTFAICDSGVFQGIKNQILKIAEEEIQHGLQGKTILDIMLNKEGYDVYFEEIKADIQGIFDECIRQEFSWNSYVLSEGRHVLGVNTELLNEYVCFLAKPIYDNLGLTWHTDEFGIAPTKNPIPMIRKYMQPEDTQSANQEIENTNYRIGKVVDDLGDMTFDF